MKTDNITQKDFVRLFNTAVTRFKREKCMSMEFIPYMDGKPHEQWFTGVLNTVHMRGVTLYPIERYGYVVGILFLRNPHLKFKQLMSWIDKRCQKNYDCKHIEKELYAASVCGKRGRWSSEDEYHKAYLCHDGDKCDKIKKQLQKVKSTRDIVEVSLETDENFENMEESIRNETELYGSVTHTLRFKITTPGGKVKMDSVIYY